MKHRICPLIICFALAATMAATAKTRPDNYFKPTSVTTNGSVTVEGHTIHYRAVAGTLVVHAKGWDDAPSASGKSAKKKHTAEAAMFYVYYAKRGSRAGDRPITFLYNGGPGSSTVWLHMGAFGPRRVVTADHTHTPAAPYGLVNNDYSLLDASDLVFIDAPGTGFGRLAGKNKQRAFYGVDPDAHAFAEFITRFLSKYGRWNSPKYIFGESYGTTRSAVLANLLQSDYSVDLNGVILLSQILNFDLSPDGPSENPGIGLPYELALPTYAATAWYHHKLPPGAPTHLITLVHQVEHFAITAYALALQQGADLPRAQRDAIARKLHLYTGLPVAYIKKANLRVSGGEFEKTLLSGTDTTTGRLDTRFAGPTLDPLSQSAYYDPQSAAISSAYVAAFNNYVRKQLKYGKNKTYKVYADVFKWWDFRHKPPGGRYRISTNVMPDLASAMKHNPKLRICLNSGYFDLATPFFESVYEMSHLQIPPRLQANIEHFYYRSGHMVYVHVPSLKRLHDNVASFIHKTDNLGN